MEKPRKNGRAKIPDLTRPYKLYEKIKLKDDSQALSYVLIDRFETLEQALNALKALELLYLSFNVKDNFWLKIAKAVYGSRTIELYRKKSGARLEQLSEEHI